MLPLLLVLRRRLDAHQTEDADASAAGASASLGLHPIALFGLLCARRRRLLRRHVDAAGAHRRLLRRPRLRRGARRRDAVADAGLRHHQPHRLGLRRRPHRRPRHAADRLGHAGRGAVPLSPVRRPHAALRHLGAVRPVPGRHRADVCHRRARIFPAAPGRHAASGSSSRRRSSAWRWGGGCRAPSST